MIPALKNAEFVRYGVMHRNSFINAPKALNSDLSLKYLPDCYVVGQLCGVEGYVESIATGLLGAINVYRRLNGLSPAILPRETMLGSLVNYLVTENKAFQPMNANFGILPPSPVRKKDERKIDYYNRSAAALKEYLRTIGECSS